MIQKWFESRQYLPPFLRRHDSQKDLFKCIHGSVDVGLSVPMSPPNWIDAQCYVIDVFLWYMAKRGYTLQRCRNRSIDFYDLQKDLEAFEQRQNDLFLKELSERNV